MISAPRRRSCRGVGGVGTAENDELGCERSETLDLLDRPNSLVRVDRSERVGVEDPVESGLSYGMQVLGLAARQVQVERPQRLGGRERAEVAVAGDDVVT